MTEHRPDSQALCDATRYWWEHRHEPRELLQPSTQVGYVPLSMRDASLLVGRVGYVMQVLPGDRRLVQFGGEEDGSEIVRIVASVEELLPL